MVPEAAPVFTKEAALIFLVPASIPVGVPAMLIAPSLVT